MRRNVSRRSVPTLPPDSFRTLHSHSDRTLFALVPHFDRTHPALHLHFADSFPDPVRTLPTLRARIATLLGHSIPSLGTPQGTSSAFRGRIFTTPLHSAGTLRAHRHTPASPSDAPPHPSAAIFGTHRASHASRRVGSVIDRHALQSTPFRPPWDERREDFSIVRRPPFRPAAPTWAGRDPPCTGPGARPRRWPRRFRGGCWWPLTEVAIRRAVTRSPSVREFTERRGGHPVGYPASSVRRTLEEREGLVVSFDGKKRNAWTADRRGGQNKRWGAYLRLIAR